MTRFLVAIISLLSGLVAHGSLPRWFDAANRLTNTISPLGYSNSVSYNPQGLVATATDAAGETTTFNYDGKGRLTNRTDSLGSTLYRYNPNDNLTNISENGLTNSWVYDAYGRVAKYTEPFGNSIGYRYDANGNLTNLIYPGNRVVSYAYDSLNRLTNVTDWANRKTSFTYDLAGRMVSLTRPNRTVRTNGYDAAGQLTNFLESTSTGWPLVLAKLNFDAAGRMAWEFLAPPPHTNAPPSRTMTYDDDNRLATVNGSAVTLDASGNLTVGPLTNDTFAAYTYDARNRLVGTTSTATLTYGYDPAGNRVAMTNGADVTQFVIDPNAKLPRVLMRVKAGSTNYYIYGAGLLYEITETATSTNTRSYHYDYRGSTVALSDDAGRVTDRIQYSLYGSLTYRLGSTDTPFLFNGRYGVITDPNGLLYMMARYYNPYLCRFINPDPSGFSGGLNLYAFANGNPISLLDPFGLGAAGEGAVSSWLNYNNFAKTIVPGQGAWNNAVAQFQNGNYGSAAFSTVDMVGQQLLFIATMGMSSEATPMLNSSRAILNQVEQGTSQTAINAAEGTMGKTIGLGLDEDLMNLRGTGAITYKNAGWQQAGLTTVDAGRATEASWFRMSFNEASQNAGAIRFDVSSFNPAYPKPGMTSWELNQVVNNPSLLGKTTFIQNGQPVIWNGTGFVKP